MARHLLLPLFLMLGLLTGTAFAQFPVPADLPDIKLTRGGQVYATAVQADGKLVIGGDFVEINGVEQKNLARLNRDGSLDTTWTTDTDALVATIEIQGDEVFVGGSFLEIGGQSQRYLAKLDATNGGAVTAWNPDPDNFAVTIDFHGSHVYIGGWFDNIGGQPIRGLARADLATGVIDATWNPQANDRVYAIEVADPCIYAGGEFSSIGGQSRTRIAKLSLADASSDAWTSSLNDYPLSLLADGDHLYLGGRFTQVDGATRNRLARIDQTTGTLDPSWNPSADDIVYALALDGTNIIVAGLFSNVGGAVFENIARIGTDAAATLDPFFNARIDNTVLSVTVDGSDIYAAGIFQQINSTAVNGIARLNPGFANVDPGFTTMVTSPGEINDIARQTDGKLIIGGSFTRAGNLQRNNLVRLNADGTLDTEWAPNPDRSVLTLEVFGNEIYVGGVFSTIGGEDRQSIARLNSTGTDAADPDWNPSAFGQVFDIAANDNAVFIAGDFLFAGGLFRRGLAKLDKQNGFAFIEWNANPTNSGDVNFYTIAIDESDLYVGGEFNSIGNYVPAARNNLAKLTTSTGEALFWNPNPDANALISTLFVSDIHLYVGGFFSQIGELPRSNLARLRKTDGKADFGWNPGPNNEVHTLVNSPEGTYIGGFFTEVSGRPRNAIAKILNDGSVDPDWDPQANGGVEALTLVGKDVYAAGFFNQIGGANRAGIALLPVPDSPTLIAPSPTLLQVLRSPLDGEEMQYFQIDSLTGGSVLDSTSKPLAAGDFFTVADGQLGLQTTPGTSLSIAAAVRPEPGAVGKLTSSITMDGSPSPPAFRFDDARLVINEGTAILTADIIKLSGGASSVSYHASAQTASLGFDFGFPSGNGILSFGPSENLKTISVPLVDDFVAEGNETFLLELSNPSDGGTLAYPGSVSVSILDNDLFGDPSSFLQVVDPTALAPGSHMGSLEVIISNDADLGQWRLSGESDWHDSSDNGGSPAVGLRTGNYSIEFRSVDGYQAALPIRVPVDGTIATTIQVNASYTSTGTPPSGSAYLAIKIEPATLAEAADPADRGQWRRVGDSVWRDSEDLILVPVGIHLIEFKPVAGSVAPEPIDVFVQSNQSNTATGIYFYETSLPGAEFPSPLPFDPPLPSDPAVTTAPYSFNGQIQTENGVGSGSIIREHSVLTAAHVLFDDLTLTQVNDVQWFHQRHTGDHEPPAMKPRGWYRFDGYAAQRAVDVDDPAVGPGVGSPESQNLDVAIMYFLEKAGRGGYGGFLSSAAQQANPWLISNRDKFVTGYPAQGVSLANRSRLHATSAGPLNFTHIQNFVFKTNDIRTSPGNSGGPLYVQADNGNYYAAAIYLGGTGESIFRSIDHEVVELINLAEEAGSGGGNGTYGGSSYTSPGFTQDTLDLGFISVSIAGHPEGRWRLIDAIGSPLTGYNSTDSLLSFAGGSIFVELEDQPGLVSPDPVPVAIFPNQITSKSMAYIESLDDWTQTELIDQGVTTGNGPLDDYDRDGLIHLIEFAFGLSPVLRDHQLLEPGTGVSGLPSITLEDGLRVEYVRRKGETAPGLTYAVEFAFDPAGPWIGSTNPEQTISIDGTWERVTVEADETVESMPTYFGRVRVVDGGG